jgi:hypothetical protein
MMLVSKFSLFLFRVQAHGADRPARWSVCPEVDAVRGNAVRFGALE